MSAQVSPRFYHRRNDVGRALLSLCMATLLGAVQSPPKPPEPDKAGEDIVVLGRRLALDDGEWVFAFHPPWRTIRRVNRSTTAGNTASTAENADASTMGGAASEPSPPIQPDITDRPPARIWRECLVGGDALRMMNQLAAVAKKPVPGAKQKGKGPRCGDMKIKLSGGRMSGEQVCRERVIPPYPEEGRPLGEVQVSTFSMDGNYHPDRLSMTFRTAITRASDSGDSIFDDTEASFGDETIFSLEAKRVGDCSAAREAATKP